jgi:hypothetical protein
MDIKEWIKFLFVANKQIESVNQTNMNNFSNIFFPYPSEIQNPKLFQYYDDILPVYTLSLLMHRISKEILAFDAKLSAELSFDTSKLFSSNLK